MNSLLNEGRDLNYVCVQNWNLISEETVVGHLEVIRS